ncbi:MAG: hypothetical protein AB7F43_02130 [Bacteriovoracia bacterium]
MIENTPLFLCLALSLAWFFTALGIKPFIQEFYSWIALSFTVLYLGASMWGLFSFLDGSSYIRYHYTWFDQDGINLYFNFTADTLALATWFLFSVFLFGTVVFQFLTEKKEGALFSGEALSPPLFAVSAVLVFLTNSVLGYIVGMLVLILATHLCLALQPTSTVGKDAAKAKEISWQIGGMTFGFVFILAALMICSQEAHTIEISNFKQIAENLKYETAFILVALGYSLLFYQFPISRNSERLFLFERASIPTVFLAKVILVFSIILKFGPLIERVLEIYYSVQYLLIFLMISLAISLVTLFSRSSVSDILGRMFSLGTGIVLTFLFLRSSEAAYFYAVGFFLTFFWLVISTKFLRPGSRSLTVVLGVISSIWSLLPLGTVGWAWYLVSLTTYNSSVLDPALAWPAYSIALLAQISIAMSCWKLFYANLQEEKGAEPRWEINLIFGMLGLGSFTFAIAGPILGIYSDTSFIQSALQFLKFLDSQEKAVSEDSVIFAQSMIHAVFVITISISGFFLFREKSRRVKIEQFLLRITPEKDLVLVYFEKQLLVLKTTFLFIEEKLLYTYFQNLRKTFYKVVEPVVVFFENGLMNTKLIQGFSNSFSTISRAVRLVQNGNVQFYFVFGLVVMAIFVCRFIYAT